jgi:hypothetical protein
MNVFDHEVSVKEEIENTFMGKPHVLLLGAGAGKAALPAGDKYSKSVPILRELAYTLNLYKYFPHDLVELSKKDFESAYSKLHNRKENTSLERINDIVFQYFSDLELPEEANLYDYFHLTLREKDVIATFNWDPFLIQSRVRLCKLGVTKFPKLLFLHGNVKVGFCSKDKVSGPVGVRCKTCNNFFKPSNLLYPVENKNYQDNDLIQREWEAIRFSLKGCYMLTIFGYSAPKTDEEAIKLLKDGWGSVDDRNMEQTEVISRPGSNHAGIRKTWDSFIHTGHYDIHNSFYDSFIAKHPRRTGEAYWNQYYEAKFISNNPVPQGIKNLKDLVDWFKPLIKVEK